MQKVEGSSPFIRSPGLRWPGAPPSATWRSWLTRRSAKPLFTGSSPVVAFPQSKPCVGAEQGFRRPSLTVGRPLKSAQGGWTADPTGAYLAGPASSRGCLRRRRAVSTSTGRYAPVYASGLRAWWGLFGCFREPCGFDEVFESVWCDRGEVALNRPGFSSTVVRLSEQTSSLREGIVSSRSCCRSRSRSARPLQFNVLARRAAKQVRGDVERTECFPRSGAGGLAWRVRLLRATRFRSG